MDIATVRKVHIKQRIATTHRVWFPGKVATYTPVNSIKKRNKFAWRRYGKLYRFDSGGRDGVKTNTNDLASVKRVFERRRTSYGVYYYCYYFVNRSE